MGLRAPYDTQDQDAAWERLRTRTATLQTNPDAREGFLTEFSPKFVELMLGAMLVSYHKYGAVGQGFPEKVDAIGVGAYLQAEPLAAHEQRLRVAFSLLGSLGKRLEWYVLGERNPDFGEPDEPEYLIPPGNAEYLVDMANYCLIEFMHPAHPLAHYTATDRSGSPGRRARNALYDTANQFANAELVDATEQVQF